MHAPTRRHPKIRKDVSHKGLWRLTWPTVGGRRWLLGWVILCLCWFAWVMPGLAATPRHYTELKFPPLPPVPLPSYSRFTLANGLTVYLAEDHELPLISGSLSLRVGSRWEPADKVGLAALTGEVLRSGGTKKHPSAQLNQLLEQKAALIESQFSTAVGSVSFSCLTSDLPLVFDLFVEVLQQPAFEASQLELAKTQIRGNIARRNDEPEEIADREFSKLLYGAASPYARTVEYATLEAIQRSDVMTFYERFAQPQNMLLGITGDFDTAAMRQRIEALLGNWRPPVYASVDLMPPTVTQAHQGQVFFIDQPQLTQSFIRVGHLGGTFRDPDYAALSVLNNLLNGFSGRLFNELRSRQGLTYGVYAVWSPRFDYPGLFVAGSDTRSEATVPLIRSLKAEIERLQTTRISQAELDYAKESTLNSFVFNFQHPSQTLSRLLTYEYFGYPSDFLQRYQQAVENTTIVDIERVARVHLKPEQWVILVVGNRSTIQPPLTTLAGSQRVTDIDITIPVAPNLHYSSTRRGA